MRLSKMEAGIQNEIHQIVATALQSEGISI
jgi:hypothetical protein